jgi:hypothetical protein
MQHWLRRAGRRRSFRFERASVVLTAGRQDWLGQEN